MGRQGDKAMGRLSERSGYLTNNYKATQRGGDLSDLSD